MYTVFYSWQSDLPSKYNRNLIEQCIKVAIKNLNRDDEYTLELNLDRDTKGESGTPDIVNTIFDKIANSHLFVCDISIINSSDSYRKMPNPNVLTELGYAAAFLGWENIICIFNTNFGKVEDLPFDLKFRRPLQYFSNEHEGTKEKSKIIKELENAIKSGNPDHVQKRNSVKYEFRQESEVAQKIALEKPNYWQLKLAEELFRSKLKPINQKYKDVREQLLFQKRIEVAPIDFFGMVSTEAGHLGATTSGLTKIFNEYLHPAMQGDNPIEILDAVKKYFALMENLVSWELHINSWQVHEKLEEAKSVLLGVTQQPIEATNSLPDRLKQIYLNPKSKEVHAVDIIFEEPNQINRLNEIIEYYSNNPKELGYGTNPAPQKDLLGRIFKVMINILAFIGFIVVIALMLQK